MVGTMIETPRAAVTAGDVAKEAEFFSFGTNDPVSYTHLSEEILEHIEQQAEQVGNNKGGSSGTNDPGDDEDELIEERCV